MSLHPKLDLLNTGLSEIYVATELARESGVQPVWIPYPYDLAIRTGAGKISSPISVQYENESINLLSASRVGLDPLCAVEEFKSEDVKEFSTKMQLAFQRSLIDFKEQISDVRLGHPLFHMKGQAKIKQLEEKFAVAQEQIVLSLNNTIGAGSLSNQLAQFNADLAKDIFGVDILIKPIDTIIAEDEELLDTLLDTYAEVEQAIGPTMKIVAANGDRQA